MMWNYVTLADETALAHSEVRGDGTVLVRAERPVDFGFDSASCVLPAFSWSEVEGFSEQEVAELDRLLRENAPLIFELAERRASSRPAA